jgi:hypothetical protein
VFGFPWQAGALSSRWLLPALLLQENNVTHA